MKDWAVSSAGEHHVDIVGVTGSIPVPPTTQHPYLWVKGRNCTYKLKEMPYEGKKFTSLIKAAAS